MTLTLSRWILNLNVTDALANVCLRFCFLLILWSGRDTVGDWCNVDTGYTTITDSRGDPRSVFLSVKRDGSIWMRAGIDHMKEWTFSAETSPFFQQIILDDGEIDALEALDYTDTCVISDLNFMVTARGGWHPSYVKVFDPGDKKVRILKFKNFEDFGGNQCVANTSLSLSRDKQGLVCDGGLTNSCGTRLFIPLGLRETTAVFLKSLTIDPKEDEHGKHAAWYCEGEEQNKNVFNFIGSYYHVYVKVASCPLPTDSRTLGHDAKLREHLDELNNTVIIPDPMQSALNDGVIIGWQVFVKMMSPRHYVYLQVWRPQSLFSNNFTLAGQTLLKATELRFREVPLSPRDYISIRKGDVLGLYFPEMNPLAMSSVPCAYPLQHYRFAHRPGSIRVGRLVKFYTAQTGPDLCRHYSFTAVLGNKTDSKLVEDWICPTAEPPPGLRMHSQESNNGHAPGEDSGSGSGGNSGYTTNGRTYNADGAVPVHLVLIIIGCLLFLLLIIGSVSYYKAVNS